MPLGSDRHLVHEHVSNSQARALRARPLSAVLCLDSAEDIPTIAQDSNGFQAVGQAECLTLRLENILRGYPCDSTILKEFVQNADDASASEIHFIWDWSEYPKDSLIADDMAVWQGPSLWVYNNAVLRVVSAGLSGR